MRGQGAHACLLSPAGTARHLNSASWGWHVGFACNYGDCWHACLHACTWQCNADSPWVVLLLCPRAGETADQISARKLQHSWGAWLKQDSSDASEQTGNECGAEECRHTHEQHKEQDQEQQADSSKQQQDQVSCVWLGLCRAVVTCSM